MKKILLLLLVTTLTLFANVGKITALKGEVLIKRENSNIKAKVGSVLEKEDTIITKDNSKALILLNDKTSITVGKNSDLKIETFVLDTVNTKKSEATFKFGKGIFRTITGQIGKINKERFKIKTKSASIGIRGTVFLVEVKQDLLKIGVEDGGVFMSPLDQGINPVDIKKDQVLTYNDETKEFKIEPLAQWEEAKQEQKESEDMKKEEQQNQDKEQSNEQNQQQSNEEDKKESNEQSQQINNEDSAEGFENVESENLSNEIEQAGIETPTDGLGNNEVNTKDITDTTNNINDIVKETEETADNQNEEDNTEEDNTEENEGTTTNTNNEQSSNNDTSNSNNEYPSSPDPIDPPNTNVPFSNITDIQNITNKHIVNQDTYFEFGYVLSQEDDQDYLSHIDGLYIIGSEITPTHVIQNYITNNTTHNYTGNFASITNEATSVGSISLNMNFGTETFTGTLTETNENWAASISNGSLDTNGFSSSSISGTSPAGTISSGEMNGVFLGPNAENIGGTFNLISPSNSTNGVFGANKQ